MESEETMRVPAGSFASCFVVDTILSAGSSSAGWLCRGVGYVRWDYSGCTSTYGGYETMELLRYTIPALRVVGQ